MAIKYVVSSLIFSSREEVNFSDDSITVIVGPNNSGKSSLLREIEQTLKSGSAQSINMRKVSKNVKFKKLDEESDFDKF